MPWNPSPISQSITASTLLTQQLNQQIAGLATQSFGPFTVTGIGYEILFNSGRTTAGAVPFCQVQLEWTDSSTGLVLGTDTWFCPMGPSGTELFPIYGHGPSKADQVTIIITSEETSATTNTIYNVSLFQNSRVYTTDDWRWNNSQIATANTPPGFTLSTQPSDESCLGASSIAVPVSSSITRIFGMFNGPINWCYTSSGPAITNQALTIQMLPTTPYANNKLFSGQPPANMQLIGARAPYQVTFTNNSSTTVLDLTFTGICQPI